MKRFGLMILTVWLLIFLLPLMSTREENSLILPLKTESEQEIDANTTVTLMTGGKVEELPLDVYLQGVVAAEMPALFPEEALKAQAVAARTYTMKRASEDASAEHKDAMVCDDPNHCKAYQPIAKFTANWGSSGSEYTERIQRAVRETDGEILLYENEPISAVFHSSSAKRTERAADVWGRDVPYLQSVESVGDSDAPNYESTVEISFEEFRNKVLNTYQNADFSGEAETWIGEPVRSEAGGVKTLQIGGVNVTGRQLRLMFGLRSTNFSVEIENNAVKFIAIGYGHGVGMSQYGARGLALQGMGYRDILAHYYTGSELGKIEKEG